MPDSLDAGVAKPDRPSFTGFWKRSKDQQAGQKLTFVSSKLGQPTAHSANEEAELSPEAKAKERRQQVRRAQRQHRQRKANYTKQLELDITKLRDDIAAAEKEVERLRRHNGAIRSRLASEDPPVPSAAELPSVDMLDAAFSTYLAPDYTVSLDLLDHLGMPGYQVRRASGSSAEDTSPRAPETLDSSTTPASMAAMTLEGVAALEATLSPEQIDRVINFILALEHCCWDHVDQSCFAHHAHHNAAEAAKKPCHAQKFATMEEKELNGHALTATALALQMAPFDVFVRMDDFPAPAPTLPQLLQPQQQPQQQETQQAHPQQQCPPCPPTAGPLQWQSRSLTLTNLRRLARALNPSDAELAPVQAWFELVALYGAAVATDAGVLGRLGRALEGEVQCVEFGAAMRRDAFEGVLERVVGFRPPGWDACFVDGEDVEVGGEGEGEGEEGEEEGTAHAMEGVGI